MSWQPTLTIYFDGPQTILRCELRAPDNGEQFVRRADAAIGKRFADARTRFEAGQTWGRLATLTNNLADVTRGIGDAGKRSAAAKGRLAAALGDGADPTHSEREIGGAAADRARLEERRLILTDALAKAKAAAEAEWAELMETVRRQLEAECVTAEAALVEKAGKLLTGMADETALALVTRSLLPAQKPGAVMWRHTGIPPAYRHCPQPEPALRAVPTAAA